MLVSVVRVAVAVLLQVWLTAACYVRTFGRTPKSPGTLLISNHAHDLDGIAVPSRLVLEAPLFGRHRFVASRRLFEPGFLTTRFPSLTPWISRLDMSSFFRAMGALPLENEPLYRPIASYAHEIRLHFGNRTVGEVFSENVAEALSVSSDTAIDEIWSPPKIRKAQTPIGPTALREPFRSELRRALRRDVEAQLAAIVQELKSGCIVYLTPEGRLTRDGRLCRFREAFERLVREASACHLAAIAYDPFARRRLSVYVRFVPLPPDADPAVALRCARPVTVGQLLADWLADRPSSPFTGEEAARAVLERLSALPKSAFIVPELCRNPNRVVLRALAAMTARGFLVRRSGMFARSEIRTDRRFPHVTDIWAYQRNAFRETLDALTALSATP